jgi:HEAT repeat protein
MVSLSSCPRCAAPVDPARAPVARVRASRILTYCSVACADAHGEDEPEPGAGAAAAGGELAPPAGPQRRRRMGAGAALTAIGAALAVAGWLLARATPAPGADEIATLASGSDDLEQGARAKEAASITLERVVALLREDLEGPSPTLAARAAAALARTGDDAAIARLREELEREEDLVARLRLARALARAGQELGVEALRSLLQAGEPAIAIEAATALIDLGADVPRAALAALEADEVRLAAAALLARIGDDRGLAALHEARRSRRSAEDERLFATIALAVAGDEGAREALLAADGAAVSAAGGAEALAAAGDAAALAELQEALSSPSRRLSAAEALRRLGHPVPREPLVRALISERGVARIEAAEALVVAESDD